MQSLSMRARSRSRSAGISAPWGSRIIRPILWPPETNMGRTVISVSQGSQPWTGHPPAVARTRRGSYHSQYGNEGIRAVRRAFLENAAPRAGAAFRQSAAQLLRERNRARRARGRGRGPARAREPCRGGLGDGQPARQSEALPGQPQLADLRGVAQYRRQGPGERSPGGGAATAAGAIRRQRTVGQAPRSQEKDRRAVPQVRRQEAEPLRFGRARRNGS